MIKLPESIKKIYEKKEALDDEKLQEVILHELPKFVYYSNYGNLSSKI